MTAAEIRAKYPNPIAVSLATHGQLADEYCVAGAACRFTGKIEFGFPPSSMAAEALGIDLGAAWKIERANDRGDFELAWQLLDEALKAVKS